jgi:methylthioxylose transferase
MNAVRSRLLKDQLRAPWFWGLVSLLGCTSLWLFWGSEIPLGVPGEWTWPRMPTDSATVINLVLALVALGAYLAIVEGGRWWLLAGQPRWWRTASALTLLTAAGSGWLWIVQETAPPAGQLGKSPFVLYYASSSGYFFKIRYESPHLKAFLTGYEPLMREGDVGHVGTHPPGLFVCLWALRQVVLQVPPLGPALLAFAPESVREANAILQQNAALTVQTVTADDLATLWLAALAVLVIAAATVVPLYGWLRLSCSSETAYRASATWPLIAALPIFIPKSDALFPCWSAVLMACGLISFHQRRRGLAALTGVWGVFVLWHSLAFLPVGLCLALAVCGTTLLTRKTTAAPADDAPWLWLLQWIAIAGAGFAVTVIGVSWLTAMNLPVVWWLNYRNHAGFYDQFTRTYWTWLWINPLEALCAVGAPLACAGLWGWANRLRQRPTGQPLAVANTAAMGSMAINAALTTSVAWSALFVGLLLWLSGKNSGEAARLWLLLFPVVCWAAAHNPVFAASSTGQLDRSPTNRNAGLISPPDGLRYAWPVLCLLQGIASVLTVHRVGGFHL